MQIIHSNPSPMLSLCDWMVWLLLPGSHWNMVYVVSHPNNSPVKDKSTDQSTAISPNYDYSISSNSNIKQETSKRNRKSSTTAIIKKNPKKTPMSLRCFASMENLTILFWIPLTYPALAFKTGQFSLQQPKYFP